MAQTTFSIRMDNDLKKDFDKLCEEFGMSMSTAINVFARAVVRERRIPFELREAPVAYDANPGWNAFMNLRRQAQRGSAAGMSEEEVESEIAAYRAGK